MKSDQIHLDALDRFILSRTGYFRVFYDFFDLEKTPFSGSIDQYTDQWRSIFLLLFLAIDQYTDQ